MEDENTIDVTPEELLEMVRTGQYDNNIVYSVSIKLRRGRMTYTFTLADGLVITI